MPALLSIAFQSNSPYPISTISSHLQFGIRCSRAIFLPISVTAPLRRS